MLESVATSTGAAAASARTGFGFTIAESPSELLDNPNLDAVFILTRHNSHAAYVKRRAGARQVRLCRKAAGDQSRAAGDGANGVRKSHGGKPIAFLMVGFNRRFSPLTEKLKSFFAAAPKPCSYISAATPGSSLADSWVQDPENGGRIVGELCHFVDWARAVVGCPMQTLTAAALPDAGRYNRDNVTVTIRFEDGSVANLVYVANGDRAVAKEYFEVFCGSSVARIDDFKTLSLSRNGKTETLKGGRDKGHRREVELTVEAMKQGKEAPIPFAELIEVTEATFAIEEAIRTQRTVSYRRPG